jgi:hypothetical protein
MYICIYIRDGREESITLIALCFYRHLLTFGILACLHTARHAPHRNLIRFICFVPTACVSGATQKMYTFASENFVCVYANSSLPVHQPSSFVTSSTQVIDSSRPSLIYLYIYIFFFKAYLNLSRGLVLLLVRSHCDGSKVLDDTFGVHSLSSTGFSTGYENEVI